MYKFSKYRAESYDMLVLGIRKRFTKEVVFGVGVEMGRVLASRERGIKNKSQQRFRCEKSWSLGKVHYLH